MRFLITMPNRSNFVEYFPQELLDRLSKHGEVIKNETREQFTHDEMKELIRDVDIVLTHWGCVQFDKDILDNANKLKVLAHCTGTVAHIASEECYERGIPVLSANPVMAKYVAEYVLGVMISELREFNRVDATMREGIWKKNDPKSLFDVKIGLVGLGAVGRNLLDMLRPFGCSVTVYDPYISDASLASWSFAEKGSFEEVLRCDVVSIHASQTPETYHMINENALKTMHDGALLINSARGSLVDTEALISELQSGRIKAALDVYEEEGKAQDERLLECKNNSLLLPHVAASPAKSSLTAAIIDDIERYINGEPMQYTVNHSQFIHMTRE